MKTKNYLLFIPAFLLLTSCKKDKVLGRLSGNFFGWKLESFYVNDIDKSDSLISITKISNGAPWYYFFTPEEQHLGGNWGSGECYLEDNATTLKILAHSDTTTQGPFLVQNVFIDWNLDYDKLCDNDQLWLTTNWNGIKYEAHFIHVQ